MDKRDRLRRPVPPTPPAAAAAAAAAAAGGGDGVLARANGNDKDGKDGAGGTGKPRLMIRKVTLENFKSYSGKKILGTFSHRMNGILGPNGSGKSNVLDAFLFVFAKKARKIRMNRVAELVHHSSSSQPDSAKVTVDFQEIVDMPDDDPVGYRVVEGSEFRISRRAGKDNSSTYYINDRQATMANVTHALRQHGIDLTHNRFLILQGEVEQIAAMKPKAPNDHDEGFLEYLEDVIGSSQYIQKIVEWRDKTEELKQTVSVKWADLQVAQEEKDSLEAARRKAEAWVNGEKTILVNKALKEQLELRKLSGRYEEQKQAYQAVESELQQHEQKQREAAERQKEVDSRVSQLVREEKALQNEYKKANDEFQVFQNRDAKLDAEIADLTKKAPAKKEEAKALRKKAADLIKKADNNEKTAADKESKVSDAEASVRDEKAKYREVKSSRMGETDKDTQEKERLIEQQVNLQADFEKAQQAFEQDKHANQCLAEKTGAAQKRKDTLEATLKKCHEERETKSQAVKTCEQDLRDGTKELAKATKEKEQLQKKHDSLLKRETDLAGVHDRLKSQHDDHAQESVFTAIMDAQRRGELGGVKGRLGDLGRIDEKYNMALTAAVGPGAVDYVVVNTTQDAQAVLEFLAARDKGERVTCLVMERQQALLPKLERLKEMKPPRDLPKLLDLITPTKEEYRLAFYYFCRETLVAEDINTAAEVAYPAGDRNAPPKYKITCLTGDVIDTTGAMTGGRLSANLCGMGGARGGPRVSQQQLAEALASAQQAKQQCGQAKERLDAVNAKVAELEKQMDEWRANLPMLKLDLEQNAKQVKEAEQQLASLKVPKLTDKEKKDLERLKQKMDTSSAEVERRKAPLDAINKQIQELTAKISNAEPPEVKKQKEKLQKAEKALSELKNDVSRLRLEAARHRTRAEEAQQKADKLAKEAENSQTLLAEKEAAKQQLEDAAMPQFEKVEAAKKALTDKQEEKSSHQSEQKRAAEQLKALELAKIKIDQRKHDQETKLAAVTHKVRAHEKEILRFKKQYYELPVVREHDDRDDHEADDQPHEDGLGAAEEGELDMMDIDDEGGEGEGEDDRQQRQQQTQRRKMKKKAADKARRKKGNDADRGGRGRDDRPDCPFRMRTADELDQITEEDLQDEIREVMAGRLGPHPELSVIDKYNTKLRLLDKRTREHQQVSDACSHAMGMLREFECKRRTTFEAGFDVIAKKLTEMYQMITLGGDARLEPVVPNDPFEKGVNLSIRPHEKPWKPIQHLSGGEKTLSSLALVFALHHYKPTPIYFMDEIDAALDESNVTRIAEYVKMQARSAQFLVISLRNNCFEKVDRMVGICKRQGCSHALTVDARELGATVDDDIDMPPITFTPYNPLQERKPRRFDDDLDDDDDDDQQQQQQQNLAAVGAAGGPPPPPPIFAASPPHPHPVNMSIIKQEPAEDHAHHTQQQQQPQQNGAAATPTQQTQQTQQMLLQLPLAGPPQPHPHPHPQTPHGDPDDAFENEEMADGNGDGDGTDRRAGSSGGKRKRDETDEREEEDEQEQQEEEDDDGNAAGEDNHHYRHAQENGHEPERGGGMHRDGDNEQQQQQQDDHDNDENMAMGMGNGGGGGGGEGDGEGDEEEAEEEEEEDDSPPVRRTNRRGKRLLSDS
ncbi:unnamed protein product [Vitrella brassicaformis CCMP3155]|uniref:SMC hinge domain-containing protein n=4 Tax=Vitrella brassicaformis TaxID=1169539 RepID=A0A0G4G589_VITBC|nr:unnamed protein product [Vitrella brassicaformis CCMP3155]|eukprot:CEM23492.1 unnamed protein product [Vitrella brassicaformis CCMP3155]